MKKIRLLFVCLGNICRSPAAEAIMNTMIQKQNLASFIECDSAGTSGYHEGESADARMSDFAGQRGYRILGRSRQIAAATDFEIFDYIITMDRSNYRQVLALDREGRHHSKVVPMVKYCRIHRVEEVPDPYYQGDEGFRLVLDILEDACAELLTHLKQQVINET